MGSVGDKRIAKMKREKLTLKYLKIEDIDVSQLNVRRSNLQKGINELANSIREIGVQQPVMVFKKGDRYELIIGQRRYLACKKADVTEIPAIITNIRDRTHFIIKSLSENIHRRELDYRDKMQAALELQRRLKTVDAVAKFLGVTSQTVKNYFGYAGVPDEIKEMVTNKKFSASVAIRISKGIEDEKLALKVAEKIKDMPRSKERNLLIDVAIVNPHEKRVNKLVKMASQMGKMKKITIYVTQRVYDAICEASREYETDRQMVVKEAIEEWLTRKGFYK